MNDEELRSRPRPSDYAERLSESYMRSMSDKMARGFRERGLIPTNNLHMYFVDHPEVFAEPGEPSPVDYRAMKPKPVSDLIDRFRAEHPDLWRLGVDAETGVPEESDFWERFWIRAEAFDRIIRVLGPMADEAGVDPLDVCR